MRGPIALLRRVVELFDEIGIDYAVGGSFASSAMGEARMTMDLDVAAKLDLAQLTILMDRASDDFYIPSEAARHAVLHPDGMTSSFNLNDLQGRMKVDLFVLGDGVLDERQIRRRFPVEIDDVEVWLAEVAAER